jgi:hypothetical protein
MMRTVALALNLLMYACAVSGVDPAPRNHAEAFACYEAFDAAREGWELFVGPVPKRCQYLDTSYRIEIMSDPHCPPPEGENQVAIACHNTLHWIRIQAGMSEERTVEASIHEWFHALEACVNGDPDNHHSDPNVFGEDRGRVPHEGGDETAQRYAISVAPVGPCLESAE